MWIEPREVREKERNRSFRLSMKRGSSVTESFSPEFSRRTRRAETSAGGARSRRVRIYKKQAKLDGKWLDPVIVERLVSENSN
jgi:hypothetical protein